MAYYNRKPRTGRPPGRPKPKVLIAKHDNGWDGFAILLAPVIYGITYQGDLINIREDFMSEVSHKLCNKYVRSTWTCKAHAARMCTRLSEMFNSTDFRVVALTTVEAAAD